jgi:DNA anti-recombination protein RmuC
LDISRAGIDADFVDDVLEKLTPGKWAVVSDISEEWETPVDTRMATLGGTVFRTTRHDVVHEQDAKRVADLKAEIALLKEEQAKSRTEQKAKLQSKIDNLNKKLRAKLEQAKQRSDQQEKEAKAKLEALQKKVAKAKGEAKAKIEARIADIKKESKKSTESPD